MYWTAVMCSFNLMAQDQEKYSDSHLSEMSLKELLEVKVYSITKQEEKLSDAPMSVYQLTSEELNRWGVRYLFETMGRVPGYSFYNTDNYGQYGVIARGWQSIWRYGYSLELMPIEDFGHSAFPHEFFGSIEAVRGPAGLAWGSGANAGLMNLRLRDNLDGIELVSSYGNYNQYSVSTMYGSDLGKKGNMFFGFNQKGQNPHTIHDAFGQPGNNWKVNGLRPSYSFVAKMEYNDFKAIAYSERNDHVSPQLWFENAYVRDSVTQQWQPTRYAEYWQAIRDSTGTAPHDELSVWSYRMEYKLPIRSRAFEISLYHNFYQKTWNMDAVGVDGQRRRDFGFNATAKLFKSRGVLSMGSDLFSQSEVHLYPANHRLARAYDIDWYSGVYTPSKITSHNAFAQLTYDITNELKLISGGRLDYQDDGVFNDLMCFYRGGLVYYANEQMVIKYFYNNAPRRPRANERILTTPKEEVLDAHELALIGNNSGMLEYSITCYYQSLDNQITRDNESFNDFTNTGGMRVWGVEWGVEARPSDNTLFYVNGSSITPRVTNERRSILEPANSNKQPLFVPQFNSFIGMEQDIMDWVRFNIAWRSIRNIPYIDGDEKRAYADFIDVSLISKKLWNKVELSIVALNLFDNRKGLPAYGEHARNQPGTIEPEGLRYYFKTRFSLPNSKE